MTELVRAARKPRHETLSGGGTSSPVAASQRRVHNTPALSWQSAWQSTSHHQTGL